MKPRFAKAPLAVVAALALAAALPSCARHGSVVASPPRVVIVTPTEAAAGGAFRGAEAFVRSNEAKGPRGGATHAVFPDKPASGGAEAAFSDFVAAAARDPLVKAIVVNPALPGCAEGFRLAREARLKDSRPEILCVAGDSREDGLVIEASADLVVDLDRVYRAYLIPWAARKMGAKALVAAYARGEDSDPVAARERAIMSAACSELGLRYAAMVAPPGVDSAGYARAMTGTWLRDFGPDAGLYCSAAELAPPLLAGAIAGGGIAADLAAGPTRAAYAAALGLDLGEAKGDPRKERRIVEDAVARLGGRGRFGLWEADYAEASVEGLAEFAARAASGAPRRDDAKDLLAALGARAPAAAWLAAYDVDPDTGVRSANRVLLRQDIYALGTGYLQSALPVVPAKYLSLVPPASHY